MMPPEPGAPAESSPIVRFTPGSERVDPDECRRVLERLVTSREFASVSGGHHVEFGAARQDSCTPDKAVAPYPCWVIDYYDYPALAGMRAEVASAGVVIAPFPGIDVSPEEAVAADQIGTSDPSVRRVLGTGTWTPWLFENITDDEGRPCSVERCFRLSRWNEQNELLSIDVNLSRGRVESVNAP
jgi:hypothetical protein